LKRSLPSPRFADGDDATGVALGMRRVCSAADGDETRAEATDATCPFDDGSADAGLDVVAAVTAPTGAFDTAAVDGIAPAVFESVAFFESARVASGLGASSFSGP